MSIHPYNNTATQTSVEKSQRAETSYNTFKSTEEGKIDVTANKQTAVTYQNLSDSAKQAQQKYEDALTAYANRISPENPYQNKNITLADGTKGYVNNLGYFQPYDAINNTAGFNKCPPSDRITNTSLSPDEVDNPISMTTISADKPGNTSCGLEGKTAFVVSSVANIDPKPMGCYETSSSFKVFRDKYTSGNRTNVFSYEDCKYAAAEKGYSAFGLSNYDPTTGYSTCMISDNINLATATPKSSSTTSEIDIFNSAKHWIPKENPNDVFYWEPFPVGSSRSYKKDLVMPSMGMVVGNKCIDPKCDKWLKYDVSQSNRVITRRSGNSSSRKDYNILRVKKDGFRSRGWDAPIVLPMFSARGGNAQRGIDYMNTRDGIAHMRKQYAEMIKPENMVTVVQHCRFDRHRGWSYDIPVGSHIPDMTKAWLYNDTNPTDNFGYRRTYNLSKGSGIESRSNNVIVTVFSKVNYQGESASFRGPRQQNLCSRIPGSRFGWNDRVKSMKVESVNPHPFLKVNINGFDPPKMDVPVKSIKMGESGQIEFYSGTHRNGELLYKWPMEKPLPNDIETDYMLIVMGVDNLGLGKEYDELFKEVPPGLQLIRFSLYPQHANLKGKKLGTMFRDGRPVGRYVPYFGVDIAPSTIQSLKISAANKKNFSRARSRNYIAGDSMWLSINDILSSPDGKVMIQINPDGKGISMKVEKITTQCTTDSDGNKTTRNNENVAVYSLDAMGDKSLNGKMGYIDYNGRVHEYASRDIVADDKFMSVEERRGYSGDNLPGQPVQNVKSMEEAKAMCLKNDKCFGVVYEPRAKVAYLKDYNIMSKTPSLQRGSMFVKRRVKPDPKIFNTGCDETEVVNTTSLMYGNYPSAGSGTMKPALCDRNRFLNEPSMQELKNDWIKKRDAADNFGSDVNSSQSGKQSNLGAQKKETDMNTKTNTQFDNVYHDTSERKQPTTLNPTSAPMNPVREAFTPLAANRNPQPEVDDPSQRAKTIKFRNIASITEDSNLMVDESQLKLVAWSIAGITTAIIGSKLITKLNQ